MNKKQGEILTALMIGQIRAIGMLNETIRNLKAGGATYAMQDFENIIKETGALDILQAPVNTSEPKRNYAENVTLTESEYDKLVKEFGVMVAKRCITKLDNYKGAHNKTYKSDYRAILSWVIDQVKEESPELVKNEVSTVKRKQYGER